MSAATKIIFLIFVYLFAPLSQVWFGGLFAPALLSIFSGLIQAPGGDIKGRFAEVCKAPATGATTTIFNGYVVQVAVQQ